MTDLDLDHLDALSAACPMPGPDSEAVDPWYDRASLDAASFPEPDAAFVAALSPHVARALIARVREAEAALDRVREWTDSRGVDASDRDDAFMRGYRTAQRHHLQDAANLRRAIDDDR